LKKSNPTRAIYQSCQSIFLGNGKAISMRFLRNAMQQPTYLVEIKVFINPERNLTNSKISMPRGLIFPSTTYPFVITKE
jgi:hypothetical protein